MTIDMTSAVVASVAFVDAYLLDKASFVGDSKGFVGASYNQFRYSNGLLIAPYPGNVFFLLKTLLDKSAAFAYALGVPYACMAAFVDAYTSLIPFASDDTMGTLAYDAFALAFPLASDDMKGKPAYDAFASAFPLAFYGMKDTLAFEASALAEALALAE